MRAPIVACLLLCLPAAARGVEPMVVVSTGRLVVLEDRKELGERLAKADRLVLEASRKAKQKPLQDLLDNARSRLDNARRFLGFEYESEAPTAFAKEASEDERLTDAVVSSRLVVAEADNLWWELGRADLNLSRAEAEAKRPELVTLVAQARGELSVARELLARKLGTLGPTAAATPAVEAAPAAPAVSAAAPVAAPPAPAVSETDLEILLGALERESWAEDRLRLLETAAQDQRFTVAQVGQLLVRFPFSHQKLAAVKLLKDRLTDPGSAYRLYASFPFESDKESLKRILAGAAPEQPRPLSSEALAGLVERLKKNYSAQIGYQTLRGEVPRSWFTMDQVATIVSVFPDFEARFRALEIVRPRILDPERWQRLEPLFATMEDRARLRSLFAPGNR